MGVATIALVHQRRSERQPLPHKPVTQHWCVAPGRPGRAYRRQQRDTRFIFEHDQGVLAPGSFRLKMVLGGWALRLKMVLGGWALGEQDLVSKSLQLCQGGLASSCS
jgi:hypothetical protein